MVTITSQTAALSAFRADQTLSNDALDRARYHSAHLVPLVRWEEIYQAVYGLGSVQGVERGALVSTARISPHSFT